MIPCPYCKERGPNMYDGLMCFAGPCDAALAAKRERERARR